LDPQKVLHVVQKKNLKKFKKMPYQIYKQIQTLFQIRAQALPVGGLGDPLAFLDLLRPAPRQDPAHERSPDEDLEGASEGGLEEGEGDLAADEGLLEDPEGEDAQGVQQEERLQGLEEVSWGDWDGRMREGRGARWKEKGEIEGRREAEGCGGNEWRVRKGAEGRGRARKGQEGTPGKKKKKRIHT
jgi:hypothetical protein